MVYVRQLTYGPMKNFIHVFGAENAPEVAVVDPAWNVPALLKEIETAGKRLTAVFLTHSHADHVNGVPELLQAVDVPVYVQKAEADFNDAVKEFGDAVRPMAPGDEVKVGPLPVKLLHTPGHTPGSQCLHCGGALFSGDTLFVEHCGRCDFPGGSMDEMFDSLHKVIGALPDTTVLYPGHDYGSIPVSTLRHEREHNPYLTRKRREDFVAYRLKPRS
jgi:glyoxylase-like metal-dependent hydrolase (beta-lactamase superfamily II)